MTPEAYAAKVEKWAKAGFSFDLVEGTRKALQADASEGRRNAPKKTGALAGTIRVTTPSSTRAGKTGIVSLSVVAGSKSQANPVPYASVLLRRLVGWPGKPKTRPHVIQAHGAGTWIGRKSGRKMGYRQSSGKVLKMLVGGQLIFRRKVQHPGSDFSHARVPHDWLKIDRVRLERDIDRALQAGANEFPIREAVA